MSIAIPGVCVYSRFLPPVQAAQMLEKSIAFHRTVLQALKHPSAKYYPDVFDMTLHDISLPDGKGGFLQGRHIQEGFRGERCMTYVAGNGNIPEFMLSGLIARVANLPEVQRHIGYSGNSQQWKVAFHACSTPPERPEILDGPSLSNPLNYRPEKFLTMYNLGTECTLNFRYQDPHLIRQVAVPSNALAFLDEQLSRQCEYTSDRCVTAGTPLLDPQTFLRRIFFVLDCEWGKIEQVASSCFQAKIGDWTVFER